MLSARQEAVLELSNLESCVSFSNDLRTAFDLERYLTQVHSLGLVSRSTQHPDSRAILFDEHVYRGRDIANFLNVLDGFENILEIVSSAGSLIENEKLKSPLLVELLRTKSESDLGTFPDIRSKLEYFKHSFDAEKARQDSLIIPSRGSDPEYEESVEKIENIKESLAEYLQSQRLYFHTPSVVYADQNKTRYCLQVPSGSAHFASKSENEVYREIKSARKGFKKFYTPKLEELVATLEQAESHNHKLLQV